MGDLIVSILSTYSPQSILKDNLTFGHTLFSSEMNSQAVVITRKKEAMNNSPAPHLQITKEAQWTHGSERGCGLPLGPFTPPTSSNLLSHSN